MSNMINFALLTGNSTATAGLIEIALLVGLFVLMYFFFIRPQSKKDKAIAKMRNELQIGDNVTTTGGIVGRVVSIKEDTVVIETGVDRTKLKMLKIAIASNETIHDN